MKLRFIRTLLIVFVVFLSLGALGTASASQATVGVKLAFKDLPLHFHCPDNIIAGDFRVYGAVQCESYNLWIESDVPLTHNLEDGRKLIWNEEQKQWDGSVTIKITELPPVQILPEDPGYNQHEDFTFYSITVAGNGFMKNKLLIINTQKGLFVGQTNEEALFDYACWQIKQMNTRESRQNKIMTFSIAASVLLVIAVVCIIVIKRRARKDVVS